MNLKWLFAASLLLFVGSTACAPVYRTTYRFTPPGTSDGKACIFQCENTKLQCEQLAAVTADNCRMREDAKELQCKKENPNNYCSRSSCSVDDSACVQRYNSCYQTCGGKVDADTRCVSNCK